MPSVMYVSGPYSAPTEDGVERFLYSNDAQIVEVSKRKVYGERPCIRLYLCEAEPEPYPDWWEQMTRAEVRDG